MKKTFLFLLLCSVAALCHAQQPVPIDSSRYSQSVAAIIKTKPMSNPFICGKFGAPEAGWSDGLSIGQMYQYRFTPSINCIGVQFAFPNWSLGTSAGGAATEAIGLNPITVTAFIYNDTYLTFNGAQSITIQPGATAKSDPLPYAFRAGTGYLIRIYVSVATLGQKWPLGLNTQSSNNEGTIVGTDPGAGGLTVVQGIAHGYCPLSVTGILTSGRSYASVWIFGDSTFDGNSGGGATTNLDQGWLRRGLDAFQIPWCKMTVGGDRMALHTGSLALGLTNIVGGDIVIVGYGANDISTFADLPTAQAAYTAFWASIAATGAKVRQCTIAPRGSFTAPQETIRQGLNAFFRTTTLIDKCIDLTGQVETGLNTGVWITGFSTDNTHITSTRELQVGTALIFPGDFKK